MKQIIYIIGLFLIVGCSTRKTILNNDEVFHFQIDRGNEYLILKRAYNKQDSIELRNLLFERHPENSTESNLDELLMRSQFNKRDLTSNNFNQILKELNKTKKSFIQKMCSPIYRDIIIIKSEKNIKEIVKICLECEQSLIIKKDTIHFKMGNNYDKINKLLNNN